MADRQKIDGVLGFLGAGRMAQALAAGVVRDGRIDAARVAVYDPSEAATDQLTQLIGARASVGRESSETLIQEATVVVLAVKPGHAASALASAAAAWRSDEQLLVSVAAGVTLETLEGWLPLDGAAIRVMPNTPCLIGHGASCYALGRHATNSHAAVVEQLLSSVGHVARVDESLLDAVTGLSGSGPAFVYTVIEALADGGVRAGLPRELAAQLAARTVEGAAQMVLETGDHPAALRDAVASPGGTTIAGLAALERGGLRTALIEAVTAATERSAELGRPS